MKILILGEDYDRSEAHWISQLSKEGIDITVMGNHPQRFPFDIAGEKFFQSKLRAKIDFSYMWFIRKYLKKNSFDVIHAITGKALSNLLIATPGLRTPIVTYRGTIGHVNRLDPTSWITYLNPRVTKIACVSKAVERYFLDLKVPQHRLITIYKGHDPKWYADGTDYQLIDAGIPEGSPVISCVGALRPVKGVDVLIRAFHQLPSSLQAHLLLIGPVIDKSLYGIASEGAGADKIHFIGERKDAPQIVAKTDIFCMASIEREGLARAAIEAMCRGVCPVVTEVGGMPELVRHEVDGLVVPPSDADALARAFETLLLNPELRRIYGASAKARISSNFHIDQTAQSYRNLYSNLDDKGD